MLYLVVVVWDKNLLFATPDSAMHHWWWWQHWWIKGWVDSARGFRKPAGSRNNSTPLLFPDDDNDDEDDIDNDEDDNNDDDDDDDNWLWLALWNPVIGWLAALERRGLQAMVTIAMIMLIIVIVIGAEIVVLIVIIVLRLGCATFPPPVIESSQSASTAPTTRWEYRQHQRRHHHQHHCHHHCHQHHGFIMRSRPPKLCWNYDDDEKSRFMDQISKMKDQESRIKDQGSKTKDQQGKIDRRIFISGLFYIQGQTVSMFSSVSDASVYEECEWQSQAGQIGCLWMGSSTSSVITTGSPVGANNPPMEWEWSVKGKKRCG